MKRILLDDFDLRALIKCLYQFRGHCPAEERNEIVDLMFSLIETVEQMRPGRKKMISFEAEEYRLICHCLNDWRNILLSTGEAGKAEAVAEIMSKFIR